MDYDIIIDALIDQVTRSLARAEAMLQMAWTDSQRTTLKRRIRILKAMLVAATKEA